MTRTISVAAQWALYGKALDAQGYRVVACSGGELDRANFSDAISRFALGALDNLPQASVSYLQPATRPGGSYLALAIHWFAVPGQRHANGVLPLDDLGRQTAFTSYFATPYKVLADEGVSYLDLYQALRAVTLPVTDGPPEPVTITLAAPAVPAIGELEMRAAALLLTGTPVCVLGAEQTTMLERLAFIDTVMALLPYGFRARMTAATWTKATNSGHRFRLFFSSAPRSAQQPDHVLHWDQPEEAPVPRGYAQDYIETLDDKLSPVARLRELTTEIGFGAKAATQALELLDGTRLRATRRPALPARRDSRSASTSASGQAGEARAGGPRNRRAPGTPAAVAADPTAAGARAGASPEADPNERALRECADYVADENATGLRSSIRWLENQAKTAVIDDGRRGSYRSLIARYRLLDPHPALKKQEGELYAALLSLAFGRPLGYQGYCRVEQCLSIEPGNRPHAALLTAMERGGFAEPVAATLVLGHLDPGKLHKWLRSGRVDAVRLISLLGGTWRYDAHAEALCEATLAYLRLCPDLYDPGEVRTALRQRGFLARSLYLRHPGDEQYQFSALHELLQAAYPGGLDRAAILQVLTGSSHPPTPALFAAVMKLLVVPGDWELACRAYLHGSATLIGVDRATSAELLERVPDLLQSDAYADTRPAPVDRFTAR